MSRSMRNSVGLSVLLLCTLVVAGCDYGQPTPQLPPTNVTVNVPPSQPVDTSGLWVLLGGFVIGCFVLLILAVLGWTLWGTEKKQRKDMERYVRELTGEAIEVIRIEASRGPQPYVRRAQLTAPPQGR